MIFGVECLAVSRSEYGNRNSLFLGVPGRPSVPLGGRFVSLGVCQFSSKFVGVAVVVAVVAVVVLVLCASERVCHFLPVHSRKVDAQNRIGKLGDFSPVPSRVG